VPCRKQKRVENSSLRVRLLVATLVSSLACLLCAAGCASAKRDTAEAAVATSSADFAAIRDDAMKYSPTQAAAVESALQSARSSLAKGDYSKALTAANDIPSQIQELSFSIRDRKDELRDDWEELSATVPDLMRETRTRIDHLERARKPATELQAVLATAQKQWQSANNFYTSDELLTAVNTAYSTKDELIALQSNAEAKSEK